MEVISYVTESRMLAFCLRPVSRSSVLAPSPNRRSNATRGFTSVGSGCVGELQEMEFVYAQLQPQLQLPKLPMSSTPSWSEDKIVSWPYFWAINWSTVTPRYGLTALRRGRAPESRTAPRAWSPPGSSV